MGARATLLGLMAAGLALGADAQTHAPNRFDRPVLRMSLTPRTGLVFQPAERRPWGQLPGNASEAPEQALGLEVKSSKPGKDLRQVLRVQLSSKESLQFRPRSGGLAVSYRAQF